MSQISCFVVAEVYGSYMFSEVSKFLIYENLSNNKVRSSRPKKGLQF